MDSDDDGDGSQQGKKKKKHRPKVEKLKLKVKLLLFYLHPFFWGIFHHSKIYPGRPFRCTRQKRKFPREKN